MEEDIFEKYKRIATRIDAEFTNESLVSKYSEIKRIRISRKIEGARIDFLAHDMKTLAAHRVGYSRPYSGIFIPIINKFNFQLHIVNKFGFDFLKPMISSKYHNSSYSDFNRKFLIKTNDISNMEKVIKRQETRMLIERLKVAHIGIGKKNVFINNNMIIEDDSFYIEQDHWIEDEKVISDLLQVGSYVISDLLNSRIIECKH